MSSLDLRLFLEIEKVLTELQEQLASELILGKAQSFDDYRYRVGRMKGVADALHAAREANKRIIGVGNDER
jgi:hypothetical protein